MNQLTNVVRIDVIRCDECGTVQYANVEMTPYDPRPGFVHDCISCGHVISESEWNEVSEVEKLRWQLEGAVHYIKVATEIMTPGQVGQWTGVRAFLESLE